MMIWRDDTGRETPVNGCDAFEATLPDYLDETLAPDAARDSSGATPRRAPRAAHWCATCKRSAPRRVRCRRCDLRATCGRASRRGSHRPRLTDPTCRLALRSGRLVRACSAMRRWFGPQYATRVSALAAGLVIATAGITYMATRALVGSPHGTRLDQPSKHDPRSWPGSIRSADIGVHLRRADHVAAPDPRAAACPIGSENSGCDRAQPCRDRYRHRAKQAGVATRPGQWVFGRSAGPRSQHQAGAAADGRTAPEPNLTRTSEMLRDTMT